MTLEQIEIVELAGGRAADSSHAPSCELPTHLVVYRAQGRRRHRSHALAVRDDAFGAAQAAAAIIDETMVHFGGTVGVTDYAFTGTEAVGENVVRALGDRTAVLANHGNVCIGSGPESRI